MFRVVIRLIAILIVLIGVILIYDSRILTKRFFGYGDQNEGTMGLKILGFFVALFGAGILYFIP